MRCATSQLAKPTEHTVLAGSRACAQSYGGPVAAAQPAAQQGTPDISQLSPQLQQQWDHAANTHLGSIVIKSFSNKKVWWTCDRCPDGHPHVWLASISDRSRGSGCPYCTARKVCKHNSLPTKAPVIAAQWHPTKNISWPEQFTAYSHTKAQWLCPACNHTWSAAIGHRVGGSGCPVCNNQSGKHISHPTFAACKHPLLAEWDHQRNAEAGHFPDQITLASAKQIFWLCSACPAGQEHSYSAPPRAQTQSCRPSGCSQCAGHTACKCNSLSTHYPDLALEWDYSKNEGTPEDPTAHSEDIVWWLSEQGISWQQSIHDRAICVNKFRQRLKLHLAQ